MMFRLFYNQNANLIQYPHRQGNERKREHVRCRGNNRGDHKNNHNSVFLIAAHEIRQKKSTDMKKMIASMILIFRNINFFPFSI